MLKICLDEMTDNGHQSADPFVDSDDEAENQNSGKSDAVLKLKAGRNSSTTLYYVDYNKHPGGNGLDRDKRQDLLSDVAKAESEESALKHSIEEAKALATKLLSEPTNENLAIELGKEETSLENFKAKVLKAEKLQVNEKQKQLLKRRCNTMTAQWRKRRRMCMDFLVTMEENSEGTISLKKCLAGDGQIEIDSDGIVAKSAVAFAKKKKSSLISKKPVMGAGKKKTSAASGIDVPHDPNFVAVTLDSQGQVCRVFAS